MLIYNIATGNFHLSFTGQPIAHAQHLWNILGLYVVGFSAVLAGGPSIYGKVAVILCIIVLFIIACTQKRRTAK